MKKIFLILLINLISISAYAQTVDVSLTIHNTDGTTTILTGTLPITNNQNNPSLPPPIANKFLYGGQSNMWNLVNYGFWPSRGVVLFGYAEASKTIDYFTNGNGWTQMAANIAGNFNAHSFVFFLGETDSIIGTTATTFANTLTIMIAKVRALVNNPNLPIWLTQINPQYTVINGAIQTVANTVPNVSVIPTSNCSYAADEIHLDNDGANCWVNEVMAHP